MGLSNLGIFHTIIGIIAIVAAVVSYIKSGKINLVYILELGVFAFFGEK